MKKIITIAIVLTLGSIHSFSQDTISVLWLGNSYTGVNNLPQLTKNAAQSVGNDINYQAYTPGGYRLLQHASDATTRNHIFSTKWDYVTIQAQSQEPSWPDGQVQSEVFPYAQQLCDSIRKSNGCAKPVFYMTWGRENGDNFNCGSWPPVCTYDGMDSILNQNYQKMATDNKALVSPAGAVWNYLRKNHPSINLYSADESHPSQTGSYAAAITFHTIFFESDPTLIPYNYSLPASDADTIRQVVKLIVYDSLSKWNVGKYDPTGEQTILGCDSTQYDSVWFFSDTSLVDTSWGQSQWGCDSITYVNIKIGVTTSTERDTTLEASETIMFGGTLLNTSGTYVDTLTSTQECDSIITLQLTVTPDGISPSAHNIYIYPNPVNEKLQVVSLNIFNQIIILDGSGKIVLQHVLDNYNTIIDLSNLDSGLYFYTLIGHQTTKHGKLIKTP